MVQHTSTGRLNGIDQQALTLHAYREGDKLIKVRFEFGSALLDVAKEIREKYISKKLKKDFEVNHTTNSIRFTITHSTAFSADEKEEIIMEFQTALPEFSLERFGMNPLLATDKGQVIFERNNRN